MATITPDLLCSAGYAPFNRTSIDPESVLRLYQRRFRDDYGTQYFVNFREYAGFDGRPVSFEAQICCETDSGGDAWLTIREESIEATEARALKLWMACGSRYYEREAA